MSLDPELQVQPLFALLHPASHPARRPELTVRLRSVFFVNSRDDFFWFFMALSQVSSEVVGCAHRDESRVRTCDSNVTHAIHAHVAQRGEDGMHARHSKG
jgi:hypothetical protein